MLIGRLFKKLLNKNAKRRSPAERAELLLELERILSDSDCYIQSLPDWIRANINITGYWDTLLQACEKSADACRFRDYKPVLDNNIKVCYETGITHYRCGIFQYYDTSVNFFEITADSISKINDYGVLDIFYQVRTYGGKYNLNDKKHTGGEEPELSAMNCIAKSFIKNLNTLSDYRKEQIKYALAETYGRTGNLYLSYAIKKLNKEDLPDNINVVFASQQENSSYDAHTSHGGLFAVVMTHNDIPVEIVECDGTGASIYRTYFSR